MDECPNTDAIFARIGCILSYGGSAVDCWINYFLLLTSLTCWILYVQRRPRCGQRASCYRPISEDAARPSHGATVAAVVFLVLFQIALCLALHCSGISIVWCGLTGWMLSEVWVRRGAGRILVVPLLGNFAGILYYAITAEAITTVAHMCALALGAGLYYLGYRWTPASAPTPDASTARHAEK